jgi:hypothetical protein
VNGKPNPFDPSNSLVKLKDVIAAHKEANKDLQDGKPGYCYRTC